MSLDLLSLPALAGWVALAIVIDLIVGDPRALPHPVVILGKAISALEHRWNKGSPQRRRLLGGCLTLVVVLGTLSVAWLGLALLSWVHPWLGLAAELWLLATTLAIKGLADAGRAIAAPLRQGDLPGARQALSRVVGRDTQALDEAEITRGAVETVAETPSMALPRRCCLRCWGARRWRWPTRPSIRWTPWWATGTSATATSATPRPGWTTLPTGCLPG